MTLIGTLPRVWLLRDGDRIIAAVLADDPIDAMHKAADAGHLDCFEDYSDEFPCYGALMTPYDVESVTVQPATLEVVCK